MINIYLFNIKLPAKVQRNITQKIGRLAKFFMNKWSFLPYTEIQKLNIHQNYTLSKF